MSATLIYLVGYVLFIAGVLYLLHLVGIAGSWLIGVGLLLAGAGITGAISKTRRAEPPLEGGAS